MIMKDMATGRYFKIGLRKLLNIEKKINKLLMSRDITLMDYHKMIGFRDTDCCFVRSIVWKKGEKFKLEFTAKEGYLQVLTK